jgi:uncharacterized delta-60 repeat protein
MRGKVSRAALPISALLAGLVGLAVGPAQATPGRPGQLDTTFGKRGQVITGLSSGFGARAVAIQRDGKIVAAGSGGGGFMLVRYKRNGSLDLGFGSKGKVRTAFRQGQVWSLALQRDGKIIAAGYSSSRDTDYFTLARYRSNGSLDRSFGSEGQVRTPGGGASAVALQPDGRIVASGSFVHFDSGQLQIAFRVVRYMSNGTPDPSFGSGGSVTTPTGGDAHALALQPDGKIIVAGGSHEGSQTLFALVRYQGNGSLDPSFGVGGIVTTGFRSLDGATPVLLQGDGKIVVVGAGGTQRSGFALARFTPNGSLDSSFGSGGKVRTNFGSGSAVPTAAALQRDRKIVVVGWMFKYPRWDFALARYGANGSLDPSFGTGGKVTTSFRKLARTPRNRSHQDTARAVAIQRDGKIVVAGTGEVPPVFSRASSRYMFELARYIGDTSEGRH